jgi:uncharacterized protein
MKNSIYNKIVPYNEESLVYNQVSGALLRVGENGIKKIKKIFDGNYENDSLVNQLIKLGFIIENESDERIELRKKYEEKSKNHLVKYFHITVTDRCNLGCHYCFEEKNQWIKMSLETQDAVIEFGKKFLIKTPTEFFGIGWYGGEPTMHMPAVEKISKFFNNFCRENSILFEQYIISNGTTFTESICEKLLSLEIKRAQITVDGYKDDHDLSRPYLKDLSPNEMNDVQKKQIQKINPKLLLNVLGQKPPTERSSYNEIIKGVERYVGMGGIVSLRMNVNEKTIERVYHLLDDLNNRGLFTKNKNGGFLYSYAHPIHEVGGCGSGDGNSNCGSCTISSMKMSSFAKKIDKIRDWYKEKNIEFYDHSPEMKFTGETCTANKQYEYVINPDGTLTKCTHDVGKPEKIIGDVFTTDPYSPKIGDSYFEKFNPFDDEECSNCEVLPICLGGCKSNNDVGNSKKYEAGCATARFTLSDDIIRLYERNKK